MNMTPEQILAKAKSDPEMAELHGVEQFDTVTEDDMRRWDGWHVITLDEWLIRRYRQRQQRLRKHGHAKRFDRRYR